MFSCGDGKCLPKYKMCDGIGDCKDNRDEHTDCSGMIPKQRHSKIIPII